ncbi:MAG: hypothetical protein JWQ19_3829 [Subtercola sp.]|nr:hypothetical protein [Subtercola sp.]
MSMASLDDLRGDAYSDGVVVIRKPGDHRTKMCDKKRSSRVEHSESIVALARRAAALIPGPPADGDALGYLAWRELVWGTALRIGEIADDILHREPASANPLSPDGSVAEDDDTMPVSGEYLLALAGVSIRAHH